MVAGNRLRTKFAIPAAPPMLADMPHVLAVLVLLSFGFTARGQTVLIKPYVQPGDDGTTATHDQKLLVWFTDQVPGDFAVEYRSGTAKPARATPALRVIAAQPYVQAASRAK